VPDLVPNDDGQLAVAASLIHESRKHVDVLAAEHKCIDRLRSVSSTRTTHLVVLSDGDQHAMHQRLQMLEALIRDEENLDAVCDSGPKDLIVHLAGLLNY